MSSSTIESNVVQNAQLKPSRALFRGYNHHRHQLLLWNVTYDKVLSSMFTFQFVI